MKKTTLYVLGGLGAAALVGGGLYFALRPSTPAMGGGGGGGSLPQGGGGGGGGGQTPPPAPNPQNYGPASNQQNQQNFMNDVANWVSVMKGLQLSVPLIRSLYNTVQTVAASFGFLLPASPI